MIRPERRGPPRRWWRTSESFESCRRWRDGKSRRPRYRRLVQLRRPIQLLQAAKTTSTFWGPGAGAADRIGGRQPWIDFDAKPATIASPFFTRRFMRPSLATRINGALPDLIMWNA